MILCRRDTSITVYPKERKKMRYARYVARKTIGMKISGVDPDCA